MDRNDLPQQILAGAVEVFHALITSSPVDTSVHQALIALGKSTAVDRVALFAIQPHPEAQTAQLVQRCQWARENSLVKDISNVPVTLPYDLDPACLYPLLQQGQPYLAPLNRVPGSLTPTLPQSACLVAIFPILVDAQLWGVLCLEDQDINRQWPALVVKLLLMVADGFGAAIRRANLEHNEREQRVLAEALVETANSLNQSLRLSAVLEHILSHIGSVVPHDAANIMLIINGWARVTSCHGYENRGGTDRVMQQVRQIVDIPNLAKMVKTGLPLIISDTRSSQEWIEFDTSHWIRSYVSAPIRRNGKTIGFLNLNSATPGFYNADHAQNLLNFANQAAIAIENARLYESAQKEITTRKQAEAALQEAKNDLERRVTQRTMELRLANDQLRQELERREQAEAALEKERALLATRVEERTAELSAANAELAKAARLKDAFLASMSHELRTPLNAILNNSETLQELVYGDLNPAQVRSIHTIEQSGRHLLSLITDILDLSKIGAGRFELYCGLVPVKAVCDDSLTLIGEAARKKNITVTSSLDVQVKTVWADQRRLKQILVNLLSNAVKFTPSGGIVNLTVLGDTRQNQVRFIVSDTGIGIPNESLEFLFKPFVQLDNGPTRQYEGTGLGLTLAYRLVELHGGGITVTSHLGVGSQFTVTLNWLQDQAHLMGTGPQGPMAAPVIGQPEEKSVFDPLAFIRQEMNELGIDVQHAWVTRETLSQRWQYLTGYDLILLEDTLLSKSEDIVKALGLPGELCHWPLLLITYPGNLIELPKLPRNIGVLSLPCDQQQLRAVTKSVLPSGTTSLVRRAIFLKQKAAVVPQGQPQVLLVDDNETFLRVFNEYLTAKGFQVSQAYNGVDGIASAKAELPDIIVMDIQMPGMNGLEAIRNIRADAQIGQTPIIAVTALAMPGDQALCLEAGANEYWSKPISLVDFADALHKYLKPKQNFSQAGGNG